MLVGDREERERGGQRPKEKPRKDGFFLYKNHRHGRVADVQETGLLLTKPNYSLARASQTAISRLALSKPLLTL